MNRRGFLGTLAGLWAWAVGTRSAPAAEPTADPAPMPSRPDAGVEWPPMVPADGWLRLGDGQTLHYRDGRVRDVTPYQDLYLDFDRKETVRVYGRREVTLRFDSVTGTPSGATDLYQRGGDVVNAAANRLTFSESPSGPVRAEAAHAVLTNVGESRLVSGVLEEGVTVMRQVEFLATSYDPLLPVSHE